MGDSMPGRWGQIIMAMGLFLATLQPAAAIEEDGITARQVIHQVGVEVVESLGSNKLTPMEKQAKLKSLLGRAIDFETTGRLILAKHWRTASDEQKSAYRDLFRPFALDNLASKMRSANAELPLDRFEVIKEEPAGKRDIVVATDLFWPGYPAYRLDWRMRETEAGKLKVIDVLVEGVSMVVSQRAEFAAVIERQGMEGLLERMRNQAQSSSSES